jgi:ribosomal protein S18 acetylase RimI-like enzyme
VQIGHAATVALHSAGVSGIEVVGVERLEESWLEAFMRIEGHEPAKTQMYRAIMSAIGPAARFSRVEWQGETAGVGMAVCERGWTGIFNIATAQHVRGRGVATAIMAELARWGLENGASGMYLQVMGSNEVAKRLYARLGFSYLYGYHYRTEPGSG